MTRPFTPRTRLAGLLAGLFIPLGAQAADAELLKKIEALTQQLEQLKAQVQASQEASKQAVAAVSEVQDKVKRNEDKALDKWLTVSGDYQFRIDSLSGETKAYTQLGMDSSGNPTYTAMPGYKPKNETMYTNRFGLNLNAKATENVSVTARLMMYKTFGNNDDSASTGPFFADRLGVFDGTIGHIPSSNYLNVDRVYASWNNIADEGIWFSVGRRPSTNGTPAHLRQNDPRPGTGGAPALLVDYAFDGMTLGWAPDIDALPGAFAKICYGRGYESGFSRVTGNSLKDTDMLGISIVPIDTDPLRVWLQWNRGMNIFDSPSLYASHFASLGMASMAPRTNVGDIDWYGIGALGTLKRVGPGELNWFADFGLSQTHPNDNRNGLGMGLLTGQIGVAEGATDKTGTALYLGLRYDLPSKTKLGVEYNRGSKNWITFSPASSDAWTSKVGTRGNVYEIYAIQELDEKPISSRLAKAFFRLGFQYYDFRYTGSNNWMGAPIRLSDIGASTVLPMTPLSRAYNAYATFEVRF
ncbi:MAG: DUF3373 family protein [Azonexus sp.]